MLSSISRSMRVIHQNAGRSLKNVTPKQGFLTSCAHSYSTQTEASQLKTAEPKPEVQPERHIEDVTGKLPNTIKDPIMVPATTGRTIVGCRCEEYSKTINWFYLDQGEAQACDCGFYFKLDKVNDDDVEDVYKVMSVPEEVINKCPRVRKQRAYELVDRSTK